MRVLGFAGTAKNTGKTTTASRVIEVLRASGNTVALTSIGYDGEDIDTVTGLPKPLYQLKAGDIVATASQCLKMAKADSYDLLQDTGIDTILGKIQIAKVTRDARFILAGPNRRTDLEILLKSLLEYSVEFVLIDGALNRIVPMIAADGIIISTGASFDEDPEQIALHAAGIEKLFAFSCCEDGNFPDTIQLTLIDGSMITLPTSSLLATETVDNILQKSAGKLKQLTIPGACYPGLLEQLLRHVSVEKVILGNPLFLVASGDPIDWKRILASFEQQGIHIAYLETLPLLFFTINPFYPRFHPATHQYQKAFIVEEQLLKAMHRQLLSTDAVNVEKLSSQSLLNLVS